MPARSGASPAPLVAASQPEGPLAQFISYPSSRGRRRALPPKTLFSSTPPPPKALYRRFLRPPNRVFLLPGPNKGGEESVLSPSGGSGDRCPACAHQRSRVEVSSSSLPEDSSTNSEPPRNEELPEARSTGPPEASIALRDRAPLLTCSDRPPTSLFCQPLEPIPSSLLGTQPALPPPT